MPKYLDLEAHFETDLASLFGMKAPKQQEQATENTTERSEDDGKQSDAD